MTRTQKRLIAGCISLAAAVPILLLADETGADTRLTGAPGDQTCLSCHTGTKLNGGSGSVKIVLPGDNTYSPGVKQHVRVDVSDPAQRRWGFELTARTSGNARAGTLTSTDNTTQVKCDTRTCSTTSVQFITHTLSGTRNGTSGGVSFEFDWTPPSSDVGAVNSLRCRQCRKRQQPGYGRPHLYDQRPAHGSGRRPEQ